MLEPVARAGGRSARSPAFEGVINAAKGEKRTLLNRVLSNCSWANGELSTEFRQPFDLLKETNLGPDTKNPAKRPDFSQNQRWLRG